MEGLSELVKKLENLEEKLSNNGSFDAILKELFTYDKDSVVEHEVWQTKQLALIQTHSHQYKFRA